MRTEPQQTAATPGERTKLKQHGDWLVRQLLSAPGGPIRREWLNEYASFIGREGDLRRATKYNRVMLRDLYQERAILRSPDEVVVVYPARVIAWAAHWGYATPAAIPARFGSVAYAEYIRRVIPTLVQSNAELNDWAAEQAASGPLDATRVVSRRSYVKRANPIAE